MAFQSLVIFYLPSVYLHACLALPCFTYTWYACAAIAAFAASYCFTADSNRSCILCNTGSTSGDWVGGLCMDD
jgi:hypothetical protein